MANGRPSGERFSPKNPAAEGSSVCARQKRTPHPVELKRVRRPPSDRHRAGRRLAGAASPRCGTPAPHPGPQRPTWSGGGLRASHPGILLQRGRPKIKRRYFFAYLLPLVKRLAYATSAWSSSLLSCFPKRGTGCPPSWRFPCHRRHDTRRSASGRSSPPARDRLRRLERPEQDPPRELPSRKAHAPSLPPPQWSFREARANPHGHGRVIAHALRRHRPGSLSRTAKALVAPLTALPP